MANVFIEARPKGCLEGSPITDYVVEDHADHELRTFGTRRDAIDWAKGKGHSPLVARVRHLTNSGQTIGGRPTSTLPDQQIGGHPEQEPHKDQATTGPVGLR